MRIVVIAGPQSAGKTTAWNFLKERYGDKFDFHEEINQYMLFPEKSRLGNIAVNGEMEKKIHEADIENIERMRGLGRDQVAETLMFHLVYYEQLLGKGFYEKGARDYQNALREMEVRVIFIDSKPEVSFRRRRKIYEKRVEKEIEKQKMKETEANEFRVKMMKKYREAIEKRYPVWKKVYRKIDYARDKVVIENNERSLESFLEEVGVVFRRMMGLV